MYIKKYCECVYVLKLDSHRMVECHTVDNHEVLQVVFVRCVVPMPGNHIEGRKILRAEQRKKTNKMSLPKQQTQKTLN